MDCVSLGTLKLSYFLPSDICSNYREGLLFVI